MPSLHFRAHQAPVSTPLPARFTLTAEEDRYEVAAGAELPSLRMNLDGQRTAFTVETRKIPNVLFRIEGSAAMSIQATSGVQATSELISVTTTQPHC